MLVGGCQPQPQQQQQQQHLTAEPPPASLQNNPDPTSHALKLLLSTAADLHPYFRYLFPPDGGWLVPGQVCFLARRALALMQQQQQQPRIAAAAAGSTNGSSVTGAGDDSSGGGSSGSSGSSGTAAIEVLEVDHSSCEDLSVLLGAAVGSGQLPALTTVQLNWCCVGSRCEKGVKGGGMRVCGGFTDIKSAQGRGGWGGGAMCCGLGLVALGKGVRARWGCCVACQCCVCVGGGAVVAHVIHHPLLMLLLLMMFVCFALQVPHPPIARQQQHRQQQQQQQQCAPGPPKPAPV